MVWATTEIMNRATKIKAIHFARVSETPEINPKPNTAATKATSKNTTAHMSQPDNPFLFIFIIICWSKNIYRKAVLNNTTVIQKLNLI